MIIIPRLTRDDVNTPTGILAAGDEVGNITIVNTGLYLVEISAHALTALAGPRGIDFHIRRELPTPALSFHRQLLGVATASGHAAWTGAMVLRGQVADGLGGFTEQWAFRATLTVGLLAGESLAVNMSLTLLATILGEPQEQVNDLSLRILHDLKLL